MNKIEKVEEVGRNLVASSKDIREESGEAYLNSYATYNPDYSPEDADYQIETICYASLNVNEDDKYIVLRTESDPAVVAKGYGDHGDQYATFERPELVRFYSWLARSSPYRSAFADKHAGKMVDREFALFRTDRPANMVVGAMTAMRQAWEYTKILDTWLFLHSTLPDINPAFHFYLGHVMRMENHIDGVFFERRVLDHNHVPLSPSRMGREHIQNFLDGKPQFLTENLCDGGSYQGITKMFKDELFGTMSWFDNLFNEMKSSKPVAGKEPLFAQNKMFYSRDEKTMRYSAEENLPIIRKLYEDNFLQGDK